VVPNDCDQRLATWGFPSEPTLSRVSYIAWFDRELAHTCDRLKPQTGFLPKRDRRVAHAPWVMCRYRNDEQITVAMFVNDKNRPQFEAAAVRKG
jgi:hypothetical protein